MSIVSKYGLLFGLLDSVVDSFDLKIAVFLLNGFDSAQSQEVKNKRKVRKRRDNQRTEFKIVP